jgi:hypothetical protein
MASQIDICNQALSWLGGNLITSLDDPQTEARLCKANYDPLRKALLETGHFDFAVVRERWITPEVDAPAWGYSHQFKIPSDYKVLRVRRDSQTNISTNSSSQDALVDWIQSEDKIQVSEPIILTTSAVDIEDVNKFSQLFRQALAARIAADICIALTADRVLMEWLVDLYETKMDEATGYNSQTSTKKFLKSGTLITSRYSGYSWRD